MKYVMEIRDLSNEGKQLDEIREITKVNCNAMTKEIEVLTENHYQAICSYFEHLFYELDKLNIKFFNAEAFGGNATLIYRGNNEAYLYLRGASPTKDKFTWCNKNWFRKECNNWILCKDQNNFSRLLSNWKLLKEAINESIDKTIKDIEENNRRKNADLIHTLHCYQNFEI